MRGRCSDGASRRSAHELDPAPRRTVEAGVRRVVPFILAAFALLPGVAAAKSNDSLAPPDAPPHWLPPEPWVYNHWIPYDEGRLYALLHITREQLWQQLRDDHRNIAQLAARHGWRDPARLADALVAPWRGHVTAARLAILRGRAVRTITQGHLSQHLFFHSLHQFAIPSRAPRIFGMSDQGFRDVRRTLELSPLTIARLHGRSPARVEALSVAALRDRARAGVRGQAITARQARILLRRQITQLPRWLGQARYNGPPKTHRGLLVALPHDYATNPSVSADGSHVVYEQYRQKLPVALRLGEIAVVSRDLRSGRDTLVSRPAAPRADEPLDPRSAYNATVSGNGRFVAYESSPGNVNFAKRYGRIGVQLADATRGRTTRIDHPPRGEDLSQSAYNPQLAADGRHVAFQAVRGAGTAQVFVCDLHTGARRLASGGLRAPRGTITSIYEPRLSADGRFVAFTAVTSPATGGAGRTTSRVVLRDLRAHTSTTVSDGAPGFASDPTLSADGRLVAFTAGTARPQLYLRDQAEGATKAVTSPDAGAVVDPQLSQDGRVLAYTVVRGDRSHVEVRHLDSGAVERVASAKGSVTDPSLSAAGGVLAFTSDAPDLAPSKTDRSRAVFARDLRAGTTTLVSAPSKPLAAPPKGAPPTAAAPAALQPVAGGNLAAPRISILDNAFVRGREAPRFIVRPGTIVTWRWRSQSSHNVTVRSGPQRFRSPTRSRGVFARRLTRAGTYRIVCTLHSPGMGMTVVVR
jgi:Tol biopolymer transport system component